ncbi:MAG: D-glycero-beta-D-manno-heptose-7-phosphate kinase, partial [Alphaproteobacteria bacterium]|nr:D-glycero-beta-D-manno-heptose-7-phosphate kinase [Alphaproteobacteria bacterium]
MHSHLLPLLKKLSGHKVLCIGDIMVDRYVYGSVDRISPEAPIPVLRQNREAVTLGGCGNVVRNIVALGGNVNIVAVIGNDQAGYDLSDEVSAAPQVESYLLTDSSRPTTIKTRFIANGQQLLRTDSEVNSAISPDMEQQIMLRAKGAMPDCDIIVMSDYAKGVLTPLVVKEIISAAARAKKRVVIDPKGRDFSRYRGAYMLTPNRKELSEATGMHITNVADAEAAARKLIADNDLQGVLAKLGSDGVCLVMKDAEAQHYSTAAREVFDVSGAGDTVVATMALALAGGISSEESAALANIAGSLVVEKIGTAIVTCEEIAEKLVQDRAGPGKDKILTWAKAAEKSSIWRNQGLKVGFTNGCFDLLHPGHIQSIHKAKEACDRLFVALNSDASVKKLKGDNRPIQSEESRAIVLAALSDIDGIVVFGEDTPLDIIKVIHPDILVKGADYKIDQVVGADLVQEWGGKVVLIDLIEGQSTTSMIDRSNAS